VRCICAVAYYASTFFITSEITLEEIVPASIYVSSENRWGFWGFSIYYGLTLFIILRTGPAKAKRKAFFIDKKGIYL
jgi:hypothetical protein